MAGDWIKMRSNLWDHPKVIKIVSAICPQGVRDLSVRCRIIGALFRTWSLADAHTDDGILDGYDADALDAAVGIDGWSLNLQHVGWLKVEAQRLIVPRFTQHGGKTAKRRAEDAARKGRARKMSTKHPQRFGQNAEQRREEKYREEKMVRGSRGAATADRLHVQVSDCQHLAAKAMQRIGYMGDDGAVVWRAAALVTAGKISEAAFFDACEACAATSPSNPIAYFRKCLLAKVADLTPLLRSTRLVPDCPKGPTAPQPKPPRPKLAKVTHDSSDD